MKAGLVPTQNVFDPRTAQVNTQAANSQVPQARNYSDNLGDYYLRNGRRQAGFNVVIPGLGNQRRAIDDAKSLKDRLTSEAADFSKNLDSYKSAERSLIEAEGNAALDSGLRKTRESFNRRGLLYSGLRQGGEQSLRGRVAEQIARSWFEANKQLDQLADSKKAVAAASGLQAARDEAQRQSEIESMRMQSQVARMQAFQQLGSVAGSAAGYYYGSRPDAVATEQPINNDSFRVTGVGNSRYATNTGY